MSLTAFISGWMLLTVLLPHEETIEFARDIQPILSDACYSCHGPDGVARQGNLRLDLESGAKSADREPRIIDPGSSEASELIRRISSPDDSKRMPPIRHGRTLAESEIELFRRWIDQGAVWGKHWAFESLPIPEKMDDDVHGIDRFIDMVLMENGVEAQPRADKRTLVRRLSLDLRGLPPTPLEVDAFLSDQSDESWGKLVENFLNSSSHAERMTWDWLDASRYSDSNGYQSDQDRTMWPWRDWVIQAFHENKPWDEFSIEQLGGDLLCEDSNEDQENAVLATAFLRNQMINGEGGRIPEENRVDYVMEMAETVSTLWLGLTFNCARCHDHKFDPISQKDYYSLFAFFNQTPVDGAGESPRIPPVLNVLIDSQKAQAQETRSELARTDEKLLGRLNFLLQDQEFWEVEALESLKEKQRVLPSPYLDEGEVKALQNLKDWRLMSWLRSPLESRSDEVSRELVFLQQIEDSSYKSLELKKRALTKELEAIENAGLKVMVMKDRDELRPTYVLNRGLYNQVGESVSADVPSFLPSFPQSMARNRLGLARWLMSSEHPLTSRVAVNRFWQMLFGMGLVKTPEDFGVQGERPLHQDLLDWLAAEFIASGWDVKKLLTTMVTSETYQRSSKMTQELNSRDPENRWFARGARFRMPAWMIRDSALKASGLLVEKVGGPPVQSYQPEGLWKEATHGKKTYVQSEGADLYRRSLYTFWRRILGPPLFFDNASRQFCDVKIHRTNTPLQALTVMNDVTYVEAARELARASYSEDDAEATLRTIYSRVLSRDPSPSETDIWLRKFDTGKAEFQNEPGRALEFLSIGESPRDESIPAYVHASWAVVCLGVLNLDEALTKE